MAATLSGYEFNRAAFKKKMGNLPTTKFSMSDYIIIS